MHSFRQSRGRVSFELACALTVSASCAGAWIQTGAWALLPAALVALLYAIVQASDLARSGSTTAPDTPRIEVADTSGELSVGSASAGPESATAEEAAPAAPSASQARPSGRKAPRKGAARASTTKAAKPGQRARREEPQPIELAMVKETAAEPALPEEMAHAPLAPLFEPEPFVRQQQQRAGFGRKAG